MISRLSRSGGWELLLGWGGAIASKFTIILTGCVFCSGDKREQLRQNSVVFGAIPWWRKLQIARSLWINGLNGGVSREITSWPLRNLHKSLMSTEFRCDSPEQRSDTVRIDMSMRDMTEPILFSFSGQDALSQFMAFWVCILGGAILPIPIPLVVWNVAGVKGLLMFGLLAIVAGLGLRASIVVSASCVVITRRWFFIPYRRYTGTTIQDVYFGGDWGDAEGACGVVVELDSGKKVHIGSCISEHPLHDSLRMLILAREKLE